MKKLLLLTFGIVSFAVTAIAQPSITLSVGSAMFTGDDQYAMSKTWPTPGNETDDSMGFFSGASGLHVKAGLGWEITDHFYAGLVMQYIDASSAENFRKFTVVGTGVQFRVNFTSSQKQLVPFFQGAYYFSNSHYYEQQTAKQGAAQGSRTQPAFSASGNTSLGFNVDFGLEYKVTKSIGLQFTAGLSAFEPIKDVPAGVDYSPAVTPKTFNGGFAISLAGGIKYYFGRGDKKRDF